jgi:hypothetical protein
LGDGHPEIKKVRGKKQKKLEFADLLAIFANPYCI